MKCERCKKNKAEFAVKFTSNNQVNNLKLCQNCIFKKEQSLNLPKGTLASIAQPLRLKVEEILAKKTPKAPLCPNCGTAYEDFRRRHLLGCEYCYEVFKEELGNLIKLVHGQNQYSGKSPQKASKLPPLLKKLLAKELNLAVKEENFERAHIIKQVSNEKNG